MKTEYEIGDEAYIYVGNHKGKTTRSVVVHSFELYKGKVHYVCAVPTPIDDLLEVRDIFSMAESADKGIGLHELVKIGTKKLKATELKK